MEYGFSIPARGPLADTGSITAMAQRGEQLGFTYLAIPDHIVIPRSIASTYPYTQSGKMAGADSGECMEQLALLAFLAGITKRARLLTSVLVVPHRAPVFTAKALATIDVLSGGRVTVGCGAGWMQEEFDAIGAPPFAERGAVTGEYLEIFKQLWTADAPRYAGKYASFDNIGFLPKPVQKPHPPLWIGGESPAAVRRAAKYGDAWYPIGANPKFPLDSIARFGAGVERLRTATEKAGRDPQSVATAYWANWYKEGAEKKADDGAHHLLTGSAATIAEDIEQLRAAGAHQVLVNFQRATLAESLDSMERFAAEVIPLVRGVPV